MLSTRGLSELRRTATLCHRYPSLRTRIYEGPTTLIEVSPQPDLAPEGAVGVSPCSFRSAVVAAWERHLNGEATRLLDLTTDPRVEIDPVIGGAKLPGGILRTPLVDRHAYVITTSLSLEYCSGSARAVLDEITTLPDLVKIGWLRDPGTDVTVIHADVGAARDPSDDDPLVGLLQNLRACLLASELLIDVQGGIKVGGGPT